MILIVIIHLLILNKSTVYNTRNINKNIFYLLDFFENEKKKGSSSLFLSSSFLHLGITLCPPPAYHPT